MKNNMIYKIFPAPEEGMWEGVVEDILGNVIFHTLTHNFKDTPQKCLQYLIEICG